MRKVDIAIHGFIALIWIGLALGMGLRLALLGNQQASLARMRGENLKAYNDMICKQGRLQAVLDRLTSPTALEEVARQLDPPLSAPARPAAPRSGTPSSVAMSSAPR